MDNNVGKTIKELRNKKGITQKQLAECIHVSDKTVSHWEKGDNLPPLEMLNRLSKFFDVPLKDLITLRVSEEENESLIQDVIDEFNEVKRKTRKIVISAIVISIIFIAIVLSAYLFSLSYNRFKVYNVTIENENFYSVYGVYIETRINDLLFLSNIRLKNYKVKNEDIISIDLYYLENNKKMILANYTYLDIIKFYSKDSHISINGLRNYLDNLYFDITIIEPNNKMNVFSGKIKFDLDFSNNKIYKNNDNYKKDILISSEEIKSKLLKNGFSYDDDSYMWKTIGKYNFKYFKDSNTFYCIVKKDGYEYRYSLSLNANVINVSVFNSENIQIENYIYDIFNARILECRIGQCNSYEEVINIFEKNVLYFLR